MNFWLAQAMVWSAYGVALLLPWLGTYTVASMLPNKLVIAGIGLLLTAGMRAVLSRAASRRFAILAGLSALGGVIWYAVLSLVLGGIADLDVPRFGALAAGVPQLAGPLYHAALLLAWGLGWLALRPAVSAAPLDRLVVRDGRHERLLNRDEIDWVEARGDYVRLYVSGRQLLMRATLGHVESLLGDGFVRVHRSHLVNVARVRGLVRRPNRDCDVVLEDGSRVRGSRTYAGRLRLPDCT